MAATYFFDESGNSGDLARAGESFNFGAQPIFSLACIGEDDPEGLAVEVERLKLRHGVSLAELKASRLYSRQPFLEDVVSLLADRGAPLFAEVVEKRFMVATYLVGHQLMEGASDLEDPGRAALSRALVEFIGGSTPDWVLAAFVAACTAPSYAAVESSMRATQLWARSYRPPSQLAEIVAGFAGLAIQEMEPSADPDDDYHFRSYLPVPDDGPSGRPMWMTPGLSSFTNINGRLNFAHRGRLSSITLVHDEQRYVERALRDGKATQEAMAATGRSPTFPFADYHFGESAKLEFRRSCDEIGLQAADIVAGVLARHLKTVLEAPSGPQPLQAAFERILQFSDPARGMGINFVATDRLLAAAGVRTFAR